MGQITTTNTNNNQPPAPPSPPPPPSPFAPLPAGQVWEGTIEFDLTVKYGLGDRRASDDDVAEAVQVALAKAGYPLGNGASSAGPVKSVKARAKANAGRRLQAGDDEQTFTITVVALAPLLQPISKVVDEFSFFNAVQDALYKAGATSILSKESAPALAKDLAAQKMGAAYTASDVTATPVYNEEDKKWTMSVDLATKNKADADSAKEELEKMTPAQLKEALMSADLATKNKADADSAKE